MNCEQDQVKTRYFLVVANSLSRHAQMQEFVQTKNYHELDFKMQVTCTGPQVVKAYCVSGVGHLWTSNSLALNV